MADDENKEDENIAIEQAYDIGALTAMYQAIQLSLAELRNEFNAHVESNRVDFEAVESRFANHGNNVTEAHRRIDELISDMEEIADEIDEATETAEAAAEIAIEAAVETTEEETVETAEAASVEEAVAEEPKPPEENRPQRRKREFVSLWKRG